MHWIYAHLIGDYILQNDWMALNKKKSTWICAIHVLTYIIPFLFTGTGLKWWQLTAIAVEHFLQDRTSIITWIMKIKGSGQFATAPMAPWSIIITDNIFHILFIAWMAIL